MSLDPSIEMVLRQLASLDDVILSEIPLDIVRDNFDRLVAFGSGSVGELREIREIDLHLDRRFVHARLFVPPGVDNRGLIIFFHGGGWVLGSVEGYSAMTAELARRTHFSVLSVDYRLAPEYKFPAASHDAIDAVVEIARRREEFASRDAMIFLVGDSAGGNLCAVASNHLNSEVGAPISAQALVYPAVEFGDTTSLKTFSEGYFLTRNQMEYFSSCYLNDNSDLNDRMFNPALDERLSFSPPTLITTAEFDPLRDGSESYGRLLVDAGVHVAFHRYQGMIHGFLSMGSFTATANRAMVEIGEFLSQFLPK